ncbi:MAG: hypothetical protein LUQ34_01130 [Euryarchaeota archaeon]|nr:hypothetical protein [Euryarchaeota archaeon]
MVKKLAALLLVLLCGSSAVCLPVASAITPTITSTAPAPSDMTPTRYLDYRVSLAPDQISNDTIGYFKAHGFTTVVLVAAEAIPYDKELQKIKQLGMYPILDIEVVIWNGGNNKSTPITEFDKVFATWREAGWWNVATEGGRSGDFDKLKEYFPQITFFNCDKCGLWKDGYRNPYVTEMSWETYYPSEIASIQRGALISYNLGKPQGITAGVWEPNNENLNYSTYKELLDWSYANSVGFTHFNVFFGLGATLADYQRLGFESIVAKLQEDYPPKPMGTWPVTVRSVRQVPTPQNSIVWDVANLGNDDVWVAPYAVLHNKTAVLPGNLTGVRILNQATNSNSSHDILRDEKGNGWILLRTGEWASVLSPPTVPPDTEAATYNAYVYYSNSSHGWLYAQPLYTTVGAKPVPASFFGLFDYTHAQVTVGLLVILAAILVVAFLLRLRRMRQK